MIAHLIEINLDESDNDDENYQEEETIDYHLYDETFDEEENKEELINLEKNCIIKYQKISMKCQDQINFTTFSSFNAWKYC